MSLISDALKTAQRQRSDALPPRPEIPVLGGFFPDPGRRGDVSPRWRGAAAGGAIGLLLIAGAVSVREWRSLHSGLHSGLQSGLPTASQAKLAPPPAPIGHAAPAAAQQGEQAAAPPVSVASTRAGDVASAIPGHASPGPDAKPSRAGTTPVPQPVTPQASAPQVITASVPASPAPAQAPITAPAGTPNAAGGVHVNVQGGVQDASDRLLEQARDAQRQGDNAAAEDVYRRAVTTHEANAEIYNNYAALLADRGDTARAITMYKLAITLDRTYVDAWSNLGTLFDAAGDHRQATGVFQQVLKLDSANVAAREGLAEQYQALGDVTEARKLFEQVTRQAPDYARAHYQMALLLDGANDATGAIREYSLFLQTARDRYPQVYSDRVRARIIALGGKKP